MERLQCNIIKYKNNPLTKFYAPRHKDTKTSCLEHVKEIVILSCNHYVFDEGKIIFSEHNYVSVATKISYIFRSFV